MTLAETFHDWLDFDGAEFELAKCLGLMPNTPWDPSLKSMFWTNNVFSIGLYSMIEELVKMGVLEMNDERQFRYNATWDHDKASDIESDR